MTMIDESARLHRSIDVDNMSFDEIMRLLREYSKRVLLAEDTIKQLGIDPSLRHRFVRTLEGAEQRSDPAPGHYEADRVAAWTLQMSLPKGSKASALAEVIALCMYDRATAEFDTFGPDMMMESIMTSICALGDNFCRGFVDFAAKA